MKKNERKPLDAQEVRKFLSGELRSSEQTESALIARLKETKEPTIRLSVDMPVSMHERLSELAFKTKRNKAEIVRFLINEALANIE